jgi:hypothetical protein
MKKKVGLVVEWLKGRGEEEMAAYQRANVVSPKLR